MKYLGKVSDNKDLATVEWVKNKINEYVKIPANADLNNYITPGKYVCLFENTGETIKNRPYSNWFAFALIVIQTSSNGYKQLCFKYNPDNPLIATRNYYNGNFGSWYQIYDEFNKPTLEELGAAATRHTNYHNEIILNGEAKGQIQYAERGFLLVSRADKFAFLPASAIKIEFSTDGGVTWTDANYTDEEKRKIFMGKSGGSISIAKDASTSNPLTTNHRCRITITMYGNRYLKADTLYLAMNTLSHGLYLDIEYNTYEAKDTFTYLRQNVYIYMERWSGHNTITFPSIVCGDSGSRSVYAFRFTFKVASINSQYKHQGSTISHIGLYGTENWSRKNNLMIYDHLYDWDVDQRMILPNDLNVNNHKILNLVAPTNDTDAANKKYVDDKVSEAGGISTTKYAASDSVGGAALDAQKLNSAFTYKSFVQQYYLNGKIKIGSGYWKIKIKKGSYHFVSMTVRVFQGGQQYFDLLIYGYMYGTGWLWQGAKILGANINSIEITFGYDEDGLWFAFHNATNDAYYAITIFGVNNGYVRIENWTERFIITEEETLTGTIQSTTIAYRPATINESVLTSDVVTTATANKILKLNANAKLPASITGTANKVELPVITTFLVNCRARTREEAIIQGGLVAAHMGDEATDKPFGTNSALLTLNFDTYYSVAIAVQYSTGNAFISSKNNAWGEWRRVAFADELENISPTLDSLGITATATELNYCDGVTSNIQTQLNSKQSTISGAASSILTSNLTANRALISNSSGKIAISAVTDEQLSYLSDVTGKIQSQLNNKATLLHFHSMGQITDLAPALEKKSDVGHTHEFTDIANSIAGSDDKITLQDALNAKANKNSPALTGVPTAPTAAENSNGTQIATTAFVTRAVNNIFGSGSDTIINNAVIADSISMGRKAGTTIGENSVALGHEVEASGQYSFACGTTNVASATHSFAEGSHTTANAIGAHASGFDTTASNMCSFTSGHYSKAMTGGGAAYNTIGDAMIIGNGTYANKLSNCFRVNYEGAVYGLSSFKSSGADYAEYFEWEDGNPESEDRVGYFVTLNNDKIIKAKSGDYILGIVSAQPCVIGNADEDWLGRWEHDEFGRFIKEYLEEDEVEIEDEDIEIIDSLMPYVKERDGKYYKVETRVVDYETPSWRYKANKDYDSTQQYIERKDRKEWDAIGMIGVLAVRDDGTCKVNSFACVSDNGIATSTSEYIAGQTYRVISRISDNVIKIVFH